MHFKSIWLNFHTESIHKIYVVIVSFMKLGAVEVYILLTIIDKLLSALFHLFPILTEFRYEVS
jgi:hypothetical protein